jgi:hypothetical protein
MEQLCPMNKISQKKNMEHIKPIWLSPRDEIWPAHEQRAVNEKNRRRLSSGSLASHYTRLQSRADHIIFSRNPISKRSRTLQNPRRATLLLAAGAAAAGAGGLLGRRDSTTAAATPPRPASPLSRLHGTPLPQPPPLAVARFDLLPGLVCGCHPRTGRACH